MEEKKKKIGMIKKYGKEQSKVSFFNHVTSCINNVIGSNQVFQVFRFDRRWLASFVIIISNGMMHLGRMKSYKTMKSLFNYFTIMFVDLRPLDQKRFAL